jgi:hypothetical protein
VQSDGVWLWGLGLNASAGCSARRNKGRTVADWRTVRMNAAKTEAVEMIKNLPDDATFDDIQHHLYVLEKIKHGQQRIAAEGGLSQDEMERDLGKWILS